MHAHVGQVVEDELVRHRRDAPPWAHFVGGRVGSCTVARVHPEDDGTGHAGGRRARRRWAHRVAAILASICCRYPPLAPALTKPRQLHPCASVRREPAQRFVGSDGGPLHRYEQAAVLLHRLGARAQYTTAEHQRVRADDTRATDRLPSLIPGTRLPQRHMPAAAGDGRGMWRGARGCGSARLPRCELARGGHFGDGRRLGSVLGLARALPRRAAAGRRADWIVHDLPSAVPVGLDCSGYGMRRVCRRRRRQLLW